MNFSNVKFSNSFDLIKLLAAALPTPLPAVAAPGVSIVAACQNLLRRPYCWLDCSVHSVLVPDSLGQMTTAKWYQSGGTCGGSGINTTNRPKLSLIQELKFSYNFNLPF